MRRRLTMGLAGLLVLVGSSLALDPAAAASATSIDQTGWWWKLQTNPDVLLPGPPTVAAGQLYIQNVPSDDGATAVAAVAATLEPGEAKPILTLRVAPNGDVGATEAVVLACQAGSQWQSGDAQAWSTKPQPACDPGGVAGKRSEDGATWTFDLTALQFNDKVNVVLVPGSDDGTNGAPFSLTFESPNADDIQTSPGDPPITPPQTAPPIDAGVVPPADGGSFTAPPVDSGGITLPPVDAALPDEEQGLTPVAPSVQEQTPLLPASVAVDPRSKHARSVGVLLLLLGAAAMYATTRQQPQIGPEGIEGGLARWVSPRWGAPPSLRG
jgi:hypothetical protein